MTATTPSLREAAKMALDALVDADSMRNNYRDAIERSKAIEALRSALALPEAEPVAWLIPPEAHGDGLHSVMASDEYQENKDLLKAFPVYSAPVERKPLTPNQIVAIQYSDPEFMSASCLAFARAIEAAHGIRGEA